MRAVRFGNDYRRTVIGICPDVNMQRNLAEKMKNRKAKAQKYEYRCGDTAEELEWKAVSFAGSYA